MELENMCKNMYYLRKENNLSQQNMAKILHIGVKSLRKIEKGKIPPRLGIYFLFYIYKHFRIKPKDMFLQDLSNDPSPKFKI